MIRIYHCLSFTSWNYSPFILRLQTDEADVNTDTISLSFDQKIKRSKLIRCQQSPKYPLNNYLFESDSYDWNVWPQQAQPKHHDYGRMTWDNLEMVLAEQ